MREGETERETVYNVCMDRVLCAPVCVEIDYITKIKYNKLYH